MILDHISYWRFIIVICLMADVLKRRDTKCRGSESISRRYSALSPTPSSTIRHLPLCATEVFIQLYTLALKSLYRAYAFEGVPSLPCLISWCPCLAASYPKRPGQFATRLRTCP